MRLPVALAGLLVLTLVACGDEKRGGFGVEDAAVNACLDAVADRTALAPKDKLGQPAVQMLKVSSQGQTWRVAGETAARPGFPSRAFACRVEKRGDRGEVAGEVTVISDSQSSK